MAEKIDTGVPIDELFSKAEQNRLRFERWYREKHPEEKPTPIESSLDRLLRRQPQSQLDMRGGKK